jgi:hypothetical protein
MHITFMYITQIVLGVSLEAAIRNAVIYLS